MESSLGRLCDNCEHRHISTVAVTWCPDCDEALCSVCMDHHDASKIANFHKTILLAEYDKLPSFIKDTNVYCSEHDQKYELYCCSHSQLCCTKCLIESHVHCEKQNTIQDVVKNVKTSPALEDIENDLKCLMTNLDSLILNRQDNKTRINAQKLACMEKIQSVRKHVNDKLDEMEKCLKNTLESDVKELGSDLDNLLHDMDVQKRNISTLQEELVAAVSFATDLQLFLGLKPLELKLEEGHSYLETLKTNKAMDEVDIVLERSSAVGALLESIESFGVISKSRKNNELEFGMRKKEQAQLLMPSVNKLSNIKFSEKSKFQLQKGENDVDILGCTILPERLLIFSDSSNHRLVIYDSDGNFIREIPLSFAPRDVAYTFNSKICVTCQVLQKVMIVDLISGKQISSFSTGGACFGISFLNEMLTIRILGTFLTTTLEGEIKNRIKGDGLTHCCAGEGCGISSNCTNHSVVCYKTNGDPAWQYHDSKLQIPRDVTVDENGCVLVTGEKSNNVFVISPNGQSGREILNDLNQPYAIHFDKTSKLVVIASRTGFVNVYQKN